MWVFEPWSVEVCCVCVCVCIGCDRCLFSVCIVRRGAGGARVWEM